MKKRTPLVVTALLLAISSLYLGTGLVRRDHFYWILELFDYVLLLTIVLEIAIDYLAATYKRVYIKRNAISLVIATLFIVLFIPIRLGIAGEEIRDLATVAIIIRNTFIALRVYDRMRRLSALLDELSTHPAKTILLSFFVIILSGALLLMLPFTGSDGSGLGFVDAIFTATSAVCVTGLIVVDTATAFSVYGKLIILMLVQIGGLGIMLLSYFTVFVFRRSMSIEDKMLISYMLSERDMTRLARNLSRIVYTTLVIELSGAAVLFVGFRKFGGGSVGESALQGVFHSISAFCNAGFSLFTDSLVGFYDRPLVILPIAIIIVLGGLSFAVITDVRGWVANFFSRVVRNRRRRIARLSLNTKVVLTISVLLMIAGFFLFYALEYSHTMAEFPTRFQYLSSLFQSITLRTAGFNTVQFARLLPTTYLVMAVFMFVGGASGSTAGGIKINTVAVLVSYLISTAKDRKSVILYRHSIPMATVTRAFLILLFGIAAISFGTILLSIFESAPIEKIYFEVVSAFGTVGLSAGITEGLSIPGKFIIMVLMFLGRLGPLTILAAATRGDRSVRIEYPSGQIAIG